MRVSVDQLKTIFETAGAAPAPAPAAPPAPVTPTEPPAAPPAETIAVQDLGAVFGQHGKLYHDLFTEAELAEKKDFDPVTYFAGLPDELKQDPEVERKLHRVYDLQAARPITAGTVAQQAARGTWEAVKAVPSFLWNAGAFIYKGAVLAPGYVVAGAASRLGGDVETAERQFAKAQQLGAEGLLGAAADLTTLADLAKSAAVGVSRGLHITTPRSQMTEEEKLEDFRSKVTWKTAIMDLQRGELVTERGPLAPVFKGVQERLEEQDLELRPEAIEAAQIGGPAAVLGFGVAGRAAAAAVKAAPQAAQAARVAVQARRAAQAAKRVEDVKELVERAGAAAGRAQQVALETLQQQARELAKQGIELPPALPKNLQEVVDKTAALHRSATGLLDEVTKAEAAVAAGTPLPRQTIADIVKTSGDQIDNLQKQARGLRAAGRHEAAAAVENEIQRIRETLRAGSLRENTALALLDLRSVAQGVAKTAQDIIQETATGALGRAGQAGAYLGRRLEQFFSPHWVPATAAVGALALGKGEVLLTALVMPLVGKAVRAVGERAKRVAETLAKEAEPGLWALRAKDAMTYALGSFGVGAKYATLDTALAVAAAETPQELAQMPFMMTVLGLGQRLGPGMVRHLISRELNRTRNSIDATPRHPGYNELRDVEMLHNEALQRLPKSSQDIVNWMRYNLGDPLGVRLFVLPKDHYTATIKKTFEAHRVPVDDATLQNIAHAEGYFTTTLRDSAGNPRRYVFVNELRATAHEFSHALEAVLPEHVSASIDRFILDRVTPQQMEQFARGYIEQLNHRVQPGETWQTAVKRVLNLPDTTTPEIAMAREIRAENFAKLFDAQTSAILHPDVFNRAALFLGSWLEQLERLGITAGPLVAQESTIKAPLRAEIMRAVGRRAKEALTVPELKQAAEEFRRQPAAPELRTVGVGAVPREAALAPAWLRRREPGVPEAPPRPVEPEAPPRPVEPEAPPRPVEPEAPPRPAEREALAAQTPENIRAVIEDAIRNKESVRAAYLTVPGEAAPELASVIPVSDPATRKAVLQEWKDLGLPDDLRVTIERLVTPYRIEARKNVVQAIVFSPQVFAANARRFARLLAEENRPDLSPYKIGGADFTPEGWRQLFDDLQIYLENQARGYTGSGRPLVVPRMPGYEAPPVRGEPIPLDQARADVINYLMGFEYPKTGRVESAAKLPLVRAGAEVAEATMPGRVTVPPEAPLYGEYGPRSRERATLLGILGEPVPEVSPFRAQLRELFGPRRVRLFPAIQRLNLDRIAFVEAAPEQPRMHGISLTIAAGFKPASPVAAEVARLSDLPGEDFFSVVKTFKGALGSGLTGHAWDVGTRARTIEDAQTLYDSYWRWHEAGQTAMRARAFDVAMEAVSRAQWAREAWEAATGVRITGEPGETSAVPGIRKFYNPDFTPPLAGLIKEVAAITQPKAPPARPEAPEAPPARPEARPEAPEAPEPPVQAALKPRKAAKEKVPAVYRLPADPRAQLGWIITPKGDIETATGGHIAWLEQRKAEWGLRGTAEDIRVEALRRGFGRISYEPRSGAFTFECRARDWRTMREHAETILRANADDAGAATVFLFDDRARRILDEQYINFWTIPREQQLAKIYEFLDEVSPRGAYKPRAAVEPEVVARNAEKVAEEFRAGKTTGITLNHDGTVFEFPEGAALDVVTLASKNVPKEHLTGAVIEEFLRPYLQEIAGNDIKPGLFLLEDGKNVSIDLNVVLPQTMRDITIDFARKNEQQAIFDAVKFESVPTGGSGETVLKTPEAIKAALDYLRRGERVPDSAFEMPTIRLKPREKVPVQKTLGFEEPLEVEVRPKFAEVKSLPTEQLAKLWPEAVKTPEGEYAPYRFTETKTLRGLSEKQAVEAAGERLYKLYEKDLKDKARVKQYSEWYSRVSDKLKKWFGKDVEIFAELVAVYSARNSIKANAIGALRAYADYKLGRYNEYIKSMEELTKKLDSGEIRRMYDPDGKKGYSPAYMAGLYAKEHLPKLTELGQMREWPAVLVFVRRWAELVGGPKVKAFAKALVGDPDAVVVDVWMARAINRALRQDAEKRWRVLPRAEVGLDDVQYKFAENAIRNFAKRAKITPAKAQALIWCLEKEYWLKKGWTGHTVDDLVDAYGRLGIAAPEDVARFVRQRATEPAKVGFRERLKEEIEAEQAERMLL